MEKADSKKVIMGLAALLVLIFHFWIPVTKASVIVKGAFIGVDLFFFVSGWSLGKKEKIDFSSFMINRLCLVYFPFFVFAIVGAVYGGWSFKRFAYVISSLDFFRRGGGAFLWYLIAILFVYALVPFLLKLKKALGWWGLLVMIAVWAAVTGVLQFVFAYTKINILLNRLPLFCIALYYQEIRNLLSKKIRILAAFILTLSGLYLVYTFGTTIRLNVPFADFYYIVAIPLVTGMCELIDCLTTSLNYKFYILSFIGKITLEIYGLQMIFGYNIEAWLLKMMGKNMSVFVFILTALTIIAMAFCANLLFKLVRTGFSKITMHTQEKK